MNENFMVAVNFVLQWEGSYSNRKDDPGLETKWGISKRAYPTLNIKELTKEQAIAIYRKDYWAKCGCDNLPYPMDIIVFDTAVNCGVQRALTWYQEYPSWCQYLMRRIRHYSERGQKHPQFFRGWINRVMDLFNMITSK